MIVGLRTLKFISKVVFGVMAFELLAPCVSFALTSGPSQPEVMTFEPVGTTDMVDLFTGDFVYNIPLLDVDGYPVNISYHGGIDMEQEASWVGLGWNINPGVIGRSMRGLPDDMNGEVITKKVNIKPEETITGGLNVGGEIVGVGEPFVDISADLSATVSYSNYRGYSVGFNLGIGLAAGYKNVKPASAGLNLGVNSATGADIDYNMGARLSSGYAYQSDVGVGVSYTRGTGYNSRSAAKDRYQAVSGSLTHGGQTLLTASATKTVPIGINNIVPVITNASTLKTYRGRLKAGPEAPAHVFGYFGINGMYSKLTYDTDGSAKAYGYLYAQNANDESIHDFTRDKDGNFNETMKFLPMASMTYDLYTVSGQGTGGSFRPFRNDLGTVYDPVINSSSSAYSVSAEAGWGTYFEAGADYTETETEMQSGPWRDYKKDFTRQELGKNYEPYYFKAAGELTASNSIINNQDIVDGRATASLPEKIQKRPDERVARGNLMTFFTNKEAATPGVASMTKILSYPSNTSIATAPTEIDRTTGNRRVHQIGEIVQTQTNGSRYVYGIPAMNNQQDEYVFAVSATTATDGLVTYDPTDASESNTKGRDNFFSKTSTPSFAHSYLLTSVLSTDYVDIKGDGPTDDDFGSYTRFNYTLKDDSYHWKAPYGTNKAQYNPGLKSDNKDDKATFVEGTKEQWMLHSIETKNHVAEFRTSERSDAKGIGASDVSYKLDTIVLYNKNERLQLGSSATPIKMIIFKYDYELCPGTPNSDASGGGKLTLKHIFIRYGNSDKGMISPYSFEYNSTTNYAYSVANKNRWGGYKPNETDRPNHEFPYVSWEDTNQDAYASAWCLSNIKLPSGGEIDIEYESDDYAYIQNKPVMDIYYLEGVGNTPNYTSGVNLYENKNSPNLYFYFKRDKANENANLTFSQNYIGGNKQLLFNVDIAIAYSSYESVKGYAEIEEVGYCNQDSNSDYGYVKVKSVTAEKGNKKGEIHPTTYQAINFGRYYLPETLYGSRSGSTLGDLAAAFKELIKIFKNPILRLVQEGKAKQIRPATSYLRLNNVARAKQGGGHRVKKLLFSDNWQSLSEANQYDASYGKEYHYTTEEAGRTVSSGVASYEPALGGDDNPFRAPIPYKTQQGSNFPPNDAIGLYQELPLGESLYPSPQVGYSKITVTSIHKDVAQSAQSVDITEYYTAADFPIIVQATDLDARETKNADWNTQEIIYEGSQGYKLVFNDMHGKMKKTEKRVAKPGTTRSELISYQIYNYFGLGAAIPVLERDEQTGEFIKIEKILGQESDLTIDSRNKTEETSSGTTIANLNTSIVGPPFPIPLYFGVPIFGNVFSDYAYTSFSSVVATKVIQQYGILESIESYNEGALTLVRNEVFDSYTGQALITSVNNEYNDIEHSVSVPAYMSYLGMEPSYQNIGYREHFRDADVVNEQAFLRVDSTAANYKVGDELLVDYTSGGTAHQTMAWVMEYVDSNGITAEGITVYDSILLSINCSFGYDSMLNLPDSFIDINLNGSGRTGIYAVIQPRYRNQADWPVNGTITNVTIRNVRSGFKNQLQDVVMSYACMDDPFDGFGGPLKMKLDKALNAQVLEYTPTNAAVLNRYDRYLYADYDTLNPFVSGVNLVYAPYKEYAYMKNRAYNSGAREAGIFGITFPWSYNGSAARLNVDTTIKCSNSSDGYHYIFNIYGSLYQPRTASYIYFDINQDKSWVKAREVTKRSPWGFDLEEKNAVNVYATGVYGYNSSLPVGIVNNARQNEAMFDGFEDYALIMPKNNLVYQHPSVFHANLDVISAVGNYDKYRLTNSTGATYDIVTDAAHTGMYSLKTRATTNVVLDAVSPLLNTLDGKYKQPTLHVNKSYLVSFWYKPVSGSINSAGYTPPSGFANTTTIIEGWQKAEQKITPTSTGTYTFTIPSGMYIDDIRIMPMSSSAKAFVYNPWNSRLMATLDENNFATIYEYDWEGNLLRTKKETEKGVMTINESRSANPKQ